MSSNRQELKDAGDLQRFLAIPQESGREKFKRRMKENPFVPLGAVLTTIVLAFGLVSFHRGNAKLSQNIMRLRVVAQGGTILALCGGVYVGFRSNN